MTDLARGCAFLGSGGGGDPVTALIELEALIGEEGTVELIAADHRMTGFVRIFPTSIFCIECRARPIIAWATALMKSRKMCWNLTVA